MGANLDEPALPDTFLDAMSAYDLIWRVAYGLTS